MLPSFELLTFNSSGSHALPLISPLRFNFLSLCMGGIFNGGNYLMDNKCFFCILLKVCNGTTGPYINPDAPVHIVTGSGVSALLWDYFIWNGVEGLVRDRPCRNVQLLLDLSGMGKRGLKILELILKNPFAYIYIWWNVCKVWKKWRNLWLWFSVVLKLLSAML